MATKRRRGDAWHYTIKRAGLLPRPIYLSFTDEAEGDEYTRRIEALLDRGVVPDEFAPQRESRPTLREGVRRYLGAQHVSADDPRLLAIVTMRLPRELHLAQLTAVWAADWIAGMKRETNLAPSTVRKHVGALARALDWLMRRGELPMNPLRGLAKGYASYTPADVTAAAAVEGVAKRDEERDRRLEAGEEDRIRAVFAGAKRDGRQRALELRDGPALLLLFDMALETAMRLREMYTLTAEQVDVAKRTIFLERTKNGDRRQVPMSSVLLTRVTPWLAGADPDALVFPWWDGRLDPAVLRRTTSRLSRQFARIFDAAECKGLHFHDLRHEATSRLFERTTLSDLEIAKITGHRTMAMLARYANLRGSTLADRLW